MQHHDFKLFPSRVYGTFLAVTLMASLVIVLLLALPLWIKIAGLLAVVGYGALIFWRYALLRASLSIISLRQLEGSKWRVTTSAHSFDVVLRGDSTVTSLLSVLRFDFQGMRRPVSSIIFRDSLAAEEYRRLVGVIRMGG